MQKCTPLQKCHFDMIWSSNLMLLSTTGDKAYLPDSVVQCAEVSFWWRTSLNHLKTRAIITHFLMTGSIFLVATEKRRLESFPLKRGSLNRTKCAGDVIRRELRLMSLLRVPQGSSFQTVAQWSASNKTNIISALRHQGATGNSPVWRHAGPLKNVTTVLYDK